MKKEKDSLPVVDEKALGEVWIRGYRCRCGHEWVNRGATERPRVCPKCKSANWDRPKQWERKQDK
jgi:predicted Zn-ribbon and HTH transcriptional regulator